MAEDGRSSWQMLVGAVVAIIAALGAAYSYRALKTDRPPPSLATSGFTVGRQDVNARLWQDPFQAVFDSLKGPPARLEEKKDEHSPESLRQEIQDESVNQPLILGVMVEESPYVELVERRLRERVAILEGLFQSDLEPDDEDHIGYIQVPWLSAAKSSVSNAQDRYNNLKDVIGAYKSAPTTQTAAPASPTSTSSSQTIAPTPQQTTHPIQTTLPADTSAAANNAKTSSPTGIIVPYEWCHVPTYHGGSTRSGKYKAVLIVWLGEEAFATYPVASLHALLDTLIQGITQPQITILGPSVSTTLRLMVEEEDATKPATYKNTLNFVCATASASDEILLSNLTAAPKGNMLSTFFQGKSGVTFTRITPTDDDLCAELVDELHLRFAPPDASNKMNLMDIALVTEQDTFYARALALSFAAEADTTHCKLAELLKNPARYPAWIHRFYYLRGIDGQTFAEAANASPNAPSESVVDQNKNLSTALRHEDEPPEGTNQSDYLRRLADQLAQMDNQLSRDGRELKAIGILGTDVYDKLLILSALRDRLPKAVFFTTDLDARFTLPSEWATAHNLVIVSPAGLRLHSYYQQFVPPFRESDQTREFTAILQITGVISGGIVNQLGTPRRFEIGRYGAHDYTVDGIGVDPSYPLADEAGSQRPSSLHPPRYDIEPPSKNQLFDISTALKFFTLIILIGIFFGVRPATFTAERIFNTVLVAFFVIAAYVLFLDLAADGQRGQAFSFLEGLSVWPTELIRLLIVYLCIYFIYRAYADSDRNDQEIQTQFGLDPGPVRQDYFFSTGKVKTHNDKLIDARRPTTQSLCWVRSRLRAIRAILAGCVNFGIAFCLSIRQGYFFSDWKVETNGSEMIDAQRLWTQYLRCGRPWLRAIRAVLAGGAYFGIAFCLFDWFPLAEPHVRGPRTCLLDHRLLIVAVMSYLLLTWLVLDASYLNSRFILYLLSKDTKYPSDCWKKLREWPLGLHDLTEYLDIRLIAIRTNAVGRVIYYPFIIFILTAFARISLFNDWVWPPALVIVLVGNLCLAMIAALLLHFSARQARSVAMKRVQARITQSVIRTQPSREKYLREILSRIEKEKQGAFSILSQYPVWSAILLPSGSFAIWTLVQYVPDLLPILR